MRVFIFLMNKKGEINMQIYKFKSLEGVSFSFVVKIISEMVAKESYLSISPFDADTYELSIGQDVLDVLPNALRSTKKLCGIDARIMYSVDKANCIILDKKDDGKFKDLSPRIFDTIYDDIIKKTCKYPVNSRSYKFCLDCSDIGCCKYAVTSNILMPEVQPPKNVIQSASEANKMTNHVIDSCITQQLAELSKLISDAVADGKFSISKDGCLKPETRKKLEELGYKVETGNQYNESYYSISWR